jgi:YVTN family beta-propeller protein
MFLPYGRWRLPPSPACSCPPSRHRPGCYVAVNGDNHVAVIDLKTWQVSNRIETGKGPDGMAWKP